MANPPNSAQLGGSLYHASKLHPGPCSSVGVRPRTDAHTDTQTLVTTIHFASSTTHAKCNDPLSSYTPCSDSRRTCLLNVRSSLFTYFTKKMALRDLLMIALVLGARSSASMEVDTVSGSRVFYPRDSLLDWYMLRSGVCLSVCHKPVFYGNGWTDRVGVF